MSYLRLQASPVSAHFQKLALVMIIAAARSYPSLPHFYLFCLHSNDAIVGPTVRV